MLLSFPFVGTALYFASVVVNFAEPLHCRGWMPSNRRHVAFYDFGMKWRVEKICPPQIFRVQYPSMRSFGVSSAIEQNCVNFTRSNYLSDKMQVYRVVGIIIIPLRALYVPKHAWRVRTRCLISARRWSFISWKGSSSAQYEHGKSENLHFSFDY